MKFRIVELNNGEHRIEQKLGFGHKWFEPYSHDIYWNEEKQELMPVNKDLAWAETRVKELIAEVIADRAEEHGKKRKRVVRVYRV